MRRRLLLSFCFLAVLVLGGCDRPLQAPLTLSSETYEGTVLLTPDDPAIELPVTLHVDEVEVPIEELYVTITERRFGSDAGFVSVRQRGTGAGIVTIRAVATDGPIEVAWRMNHLAEVESLDAVVELTVDAPEDTFGPE